MHMEISLDDHELRWSSVDYGRNFITAKDVYYEGRRENTRSGAFPISPDLYLGGRILSWEFSSGMLYLREYWLHGNLYDTAVLLNLGEYGIVAEKFFYCMTGRKDEICIECRFFMRDCSVLSFVLESANSGLSVLSGLVAYSKGKLRLKHMIVLLLYSNPFSYFT